MKRWMAKNPGPEIRLSHVSLDIASGAAVGMHVFVHVDCKTHNDRPVESNKQSRKSMFIEPVRKQQYLLAELAELQGLCQETSAKMALPFWPKIVDLGSFGKFRTPAFSLCDR